MKIVSYITILLICSCPLLSQVNGNLPHVIQSGDPNNVGGMGNAVQNGDWVVGAVCAEFSSTPSNMTCSDSNGVVPTLTMGTLSSASSCIGNVFDPNCGLQMYWGKATSTGAVQIGCSGFPRQAIQNTVELAGNLSFDAQNTATSSSGNNPSISVTSTQQNDVVIGTHCGTPPAVGPPVPASTLQFANQTTISDIQTETAWERTGAAGSQTVTFNGQTQASPVTQVLAVVAFSPTALTIGTTRLPDAGKGSAYSATLQAYGGSGSYTWSCPSVCNLQSGLSINSAGVISGTPTVSSTATVTFQVTDGTNTTTQALSLTVGNSLKTIGTPVCSNFSTFPASSSVVVSLGDPIYQVYLGDDTHGNTGYVMRPQNISDSCGNGYTRANPIVGGRSGAIQVFSTKSQCNGTVSPVYSQGNYTGTPLVGMTCTVPGAQPVVDDVAVNSKSPGNVASTTLTNNCTTVVPNSQCLALSTVFCGQGGGGNCNTLTTSTNSPYTLVSNSIGFAQSVFATYYDNIASVGSTSTTSNYADSSSNMTVDIPLQALVPLRPGAVTPSVFSGEPRRRHPE